MGVGAAGVGRLNVDAGVETLAGWKISVTHNLQDRSSPCPGTRQDLETA